MTYKEKVKAGKEIIKRMNLLGEEDFFSFEYKGEIFKLKCYSVYDDGRKCYAVDKLFSMNSMNVYSRFGSKLGPTSLELYTYDMMNQRSTYKMDMSLMKIFELE